MHVRRHYKTLGWLGLFVAALVVVCLFSPFKMLFDEAFLTAEFKHLGTYAPLLFVLVFTIALTLGFPGNVLAVVGGAVFGLAWGTVWSLLGSTLGAVGAFWLGRYLLHDQVMHRFGNHPLLQRLNQAIGRSPFLFTLAVRFTPLSPFSLVNFLFGLTAIDLKTYTLGTFLGLIPLTLAYSWLGVSGYAAFHGGDRSPLYLVFGVLTVLSILPMFVQKPSR
ncbi:MAG: TVP38/TMEM64 family protein [Oscillatoriales cyanobacterium C42_A2020_001]|nr:TVP38/TMEM64 family protein [Leptolyngbyaceae cyanobacterium C42_A2020_001]